MFENQIFKTLTDEEKIEYINILLKEDCSCGGHPAKNNTL